MSFRGRFLHRCCSLHRGIPPHSFAVAPSPLVKVDPVSPLLPMRVRVGRQTNFSKFGSSTFRKKIQAMQQVMSTLLLAMSARWLRNASSLCCSRSSRALFMKPALAHDMAVSKTRPYSYGPGLGGLCSTKGLGLSGTRSSSSVKPSRVADRTCASEKSHRGCSAAGRSWVGVFVACTARGGEGARCITASPCSTTVAPVHRPPKKDLCASRFDDVRTHFRHALHTSLDHSFSTVWGCVGCRARSGTASRVITGCSGQSSYGVASLTQSAERVRRKPYHALASL